MTQKGKSIPENKPANVTLMDGSMGEELADRGYSTRDGLWSARALIDYPQAVIDLHLDYLKAGSTIITTNTYSTIPSYLEKAGMGHRVSELTNKAAELARRAVATFNATDSCYIAGCLPPLDESYRPDLVPSAEDSIPIYLELIDCMVDKVDFFIAETMSSIDEARHVIDALQAHPRGKNCEFIVAFSLNDSDGKLLRSGESIEAALDAIKANNPKAILFNCTTPQSVLSGLKAAKESSYCPIGGYPNRFKPVPEDWTLDDDQEIMRDMGLTPQTFVDWSAKFVEEGATYLGGCCGIGPTFIQALAKHLNV